MNKSMMKKNVHARVRLLPTACRLDQNGLELPSIEDEWIIQDVTDEGVEISNPRTGHVRTLGYDHVYKFTSDGSSNGFPRGFLSLHVQLFIQGCEVRILPNARPGEPVRPNLREVIQKIVELSYPEASGIQSRLASQGYALGWARKEKATGLIDLEGYEEVVESDSRGKLVSFRSRDGMVLLKRRVTRPLHSSYGTAT